jgi:hypothetical protein
MGCIYRPRLVSTASGRWRTPVNRKRTHPRQGDQIGLQTLYLPHGAGVAGTLVPGRRRTLESWVDPQIRNPDGFGDFWRQGRIFSPENPDGLAKIYRKVGVKAGRLGSVG